MERATSKARQEFQSLFAQHANLHPEFSALGAAARLMRYGSTYGRIQELWCNESMDDKRRSYYERKEKRIEADVTLICSRFGCKPIFGGDPRGNTIKIQMPDGFTNDWGQEGLCVPTS